ncbi:MAG: MBL fold metallo-hydrolase, partial [Candidatus Heimdallarchaeota archaeon]
MADPSCRPREILKRVEKHHLEIAYIINSHSHLDHVAGTDYIRTETGWFSMEYMEKYFEPPGARHL